MTDWTDNIDRSNRSPEQNGVSPSVTQPDIHSMSNLHTISMELASRCNLRCKMCSHPSNPRKMEVMSFEQFKIILDKLERTNIKRLFFNMGEPFMNKQIFMMISYAKRRDFFVYASTNGQLLTESHLQNIFKSGLDSLKFSIEGYTPEIYEQIRIGGSFDRLFQNVKRLKELKNLYQSPLYIWISSLMMKGNEDVVAFTKFWGPYCDDVDINGLSNQGGVVDNSGNSPSSVWVPRKSCPQYNKFQEIDILSNGDMVMCCVDFHAKCVMGNLLTQDFDEIWNSEKMHFIRERAKTGQFIDNDPCRNCNLSDYSSLLPPQLKNEIGIIHYWIKNNEWETLNNIQWVNGSGAHCDSCGKELKISYAGYCMDCLKASLEKKN